MQLPINNTNLYPISHRFQKVIVQYLSNYHLSALVFGNFYEYFCCQKVYSLGYIFVAELWIHLQPT